MKFDENSILNLFDILLYFFVQAGVLYSMQIINIIRRLIMKKKLLAVLLCVAMVAAMAVGCGGGKDSGESKDEGKKSDLNIGVFYYTYADTYIASVRTALDKKLDDMGVKYQDYDGNNNQTTQNEQIDTAIQTGANLLIVNIVTSGSNDASTQIIDKAKAADVPVIFFNRAVEDEKSEEGTILGSYEKCAFVGTDAPEAGHMQGEMIGDYVVENFDTVDLNGDGKISYAMFMGQLGNAEAIYRTQFAVEDANKKLEEAGKPALEFFDPANTDKYQVDQDGAWSATAANNYMTTNLSQYNEGNNNMIELIICNNDGMAEGAVAALNDKGYNTGDPAKTIPVFGVDATDAAKKLIADGKMVGTIKQDAEGMAACIAQLTQNTADGKELVDGVEKDMISEKVANKIFIPYGIYTGEE
jgi:methyl-galactoside transport system substrate-binding protein